MWVTKDDQKNSYELCGGNHLWNNISPHPTYVPQFFKNFPRNFLQNEIILKIK